MVGTYLHGAPRGDWSLFLADGSFEAAWLTGRYEAGNRVGDSEAPPETEALGGALPCVGVPFWS